MNAPVTPRLKPIRRIVTGHDASGQSTFVSDTDTPHVMTLQGIPNFGVTDIWRTLSTPAKAADADDHVTLPVQLAPPPSGTVLRVVEFAPDADWMGAASASDAFASMGESGAAALATAGSASRHPMMHRTSSIDYAIVLAGEIWAVMDVGETRMTPGDVLIQRATNHAWSNRSTEPCLVAFVLIDAAAGGE